MKTTSVKTLAAIATSILAGATVQGQYAYRTLSSPLPWGGVLGIDGPNIVGTYPDTSHTQHGFVYNGTNYTTLDEPLAGWKSGNGAGFEGTWATGVSGTNIVGYYIDTDLDTHGFLYNGATWTALDFPGAANTYAQGISGADIVGNFADTNGVTHGFFYDGASWTTLDYPGAKGTSAQGISAASIVGSFTDTNGVSHGFLYNGATWTALDAPVSAGTYAEGISGSNIVGYYSDSAGLNHGFLYNGGNWTTLDDPLGTNGTEARGISGASIVGIFHTGYFPGSNLKLSYGFLYTAGSYQTLTDPQDSLPTSTVVDGIDGTNFVGYFIWAVYPNASGVSPQPWEGFLYNGSAWSRFANPLGVQSAGIIGQEVDIGLATPLGTVATGISGTNIVGYYFDSNFTAHGAVYSGGVWTTLDDPFAAASINSYFRGTFPNGISGSNIVGYFVDTNSTTHGFLYNGGNWTTWTIRWLGQACIKAPLRLASRAATLWDTTSVRADDMALFTTAAAIRLWMPHRHPGWAPFIRALTPPASAASASSERTLIPMASLTAFFTTVRTGQPWTARVLAPH